MVSKEQLSICLTAIFIVLASTSVGFANDIEIPPNDPANRAKRYVEFVERRRESLLKLLDQSLENHMVEMTALKAELIDKKKWRITESGVNRTFPSANSKASELERLKGEVSKVQKSIIKTEDMIRETKTERLGEAGGFLKLEVGYFGYLMPPENKIPPDDGPLCSAFLDGDGDWFVNKVLQVLDGKNMLVQLGSRWGEPAMLIWVTGVSTNGIVDDSQIELRSVFEITGTKQYTTAFGTSRTVFQFEPFDPKDALPFAPESPLKPMATEMPVTDEPSGLESKKSPIGVEKTAESKLRLAIAIGKSDSEAMHQRLVEIVRDFGETPAGQRAKELLKTK